MTPALRYTNYVVGLPRHIAAEAVRKALSGTGAIQNVAITQLPPGPIATVHLPPNSSGLHALHQPMDFHGGPLFVIGGETPIGAVLQRVLQAHAEVRFRQQLVGA
jgi:hypothetical protein